MSLFHKLDLNCVSFCITETALKMTQGGTINVTALDGKEIVGIAVNHINEHADNIGYTVYIASQSDIYRMNASSHSASSLGTSAWTLFYGKLYLKNAQLNSTL